MKVKLSSFFIALLAMTLLMGCQTSGNSAKLPKLPGVQLPKESQIKQVKFYLEGNDPVSWQKYQEAVAYTKKQEWRQAATIFREIVEIKLDRNVPVVVEILRDNSADSFFNQGREIYLKREKLVMIDHAVNVFVADARKMVPNHQPSNSLMRLSNAWMRTVKQK